MRKKLVSFFTVLIMIFSFFAPCTFAIDPELATGRILPGKKIGDNSNWIEIAKFEGYSLIVRVLSLQTGRVLYTNGGKYDGYAVSEAKKHLDMWFNNTFKWGNYIVGNTALKNIGCWKNIDSQFSKIYAFDKPGEAMGTGISLPNTASPPSAFLLSCQEVKKYIPYEFEFDESCTDKAYANHVLIKQQKKKLTKNNLLEASFLRSPGDRITRVTCFADVEMYGSISWRKLDESCYLRPAMWVKSSVFGDAEPAPFVVKEIAEQVDKKQSKLTFEQAILPLNKFVGLDEYKSFITDLILEAQNYEEDLKVGIEHKKPCFHMILTGNPGTGKTTIAKAMTEVLYNLGIIDENKLIVVEKKDLVGQYIGHTEANMKKVLKDVEGGVLFIDEAYTLTPPDNPRDFGQHVIDGILTAMTENKCVIIVAGYPEPMKRFLQANEGLNRRFIHKFHLPDYSPDELFKIFKMKADESNLILDGEVKSVLLPYFDEVKKYPNFGNAGFAKTFFDVVFRMRSRALAGRENVSEMERKLIKSQYIVAAIENEKHKFKF